MQRTERKAKSADKAGTFHQVQAPSWYKRKPGYVLRAAIRLAVMQMQGVIHEERY